MEDSLDEFAEDLQEVIIRDARAYYTDKVVDLWLNPKNMGPLEQPDGYAGVKGPCGDTIEIFLRISGERITKATFMTDGCGPTLAAGGVVTELATGKSLQDAAEITQNLILKELGGLPEESKHCALLAANTLAKAIAEYFSGKASRNPNASVTENRGPATIRRGENSGDP
jgi:nitrogen fixation NifU-like protein